MTFKAIIELVSIESLFSKSHRMTSVAAVYDAVKARTYRIPQLENLSFEERRWALSENRSAGIEWLFLEPIEL